MNKQLHNPKSNAPSVYIPCWLIQVSVHLISSNAKLLYGRLCQWSNEEGVVFRSAPQLAQEIGTSIRQIERHLKELRDSELIGTFQPQAGGLNHFNFYDHPWMHLPINKHLVYKMPPPDKAEHPPTSTSVPPVNSVGTPPSDVADINKKEIKENTTTTRAQILNRNRDSEPVVVSSTSLNPTPQNHVNRYGESTTIELLAIYRAKPFTTPDGIYGEEDFILAALFSLDCRGSQSVASRIRGIKSLVDSGKFVGEDEWIVKNKNARNRAIGEAKEAENLRRTLEKAPTDTTVHGREEALARIKQMGLKFKDETNQKLCYPDKVVNINSQTKKSIQFAKLPEKEDFMFQPEPLLLEEEKNAEEQKDVEVWEHRL